MTLALPPSEPASVGLSNNEKRCPVEGVAVRLRLHQFQRRKNDSIRLFFVEMEKTARLLFAFASISNREKFFILDEHARTLHLGVLFVLVARR